MKKTLLSCLIAALLFGAAQPAGAIEGFGTSGDPQSNAVPVIVVSVSGYDKVMEDIGFIGRVAQQPGLADQAKAMLTLFTQGQGLKGLNQKKPWGVVVTSEAGDFQVVGFVPVSDMKALLSSLEPIVGAAEKSKSGEGILEVQRQSQSFYIKEQKGWAFVSPKAENLTSLPTDPTKWLDGMDKQYEVAVRLYVHNIPEMFRSMAIDKLKELNQTMPIQGDEDEDEDAKEKQEELREKATKSIGEFVNTVDQFTLGWAIDQSAGTSHLDTTLVAIPESKLAKKLNALKETTSNYTGFMVPKGAVSFNSAQTLLVDDIEQIAQGIDTYQAKLISELENSSDLQDDESRAAAKRIVTEAFQAIKETIKTGKIDFGGSWLLGERQFSLVFGAYIKQPEELEKAFNDLIEVAKKDPNFPAQKFDIVKDGDLRFHTWTSPVPPDDKANRALGKELKGAVGFGEQSVYVAISTGDPLVALKKAIADSKAGASKKVSPGVVDVALQPILDFVNVLTPDDEDVAGLLAEVAKTPGKDHIHLEIRPQTDGVSYRLELQEGVMKLMGLSVKQQMAHQKH